MIKHLIISLCVLSQVFALSYEDLLKEPNSLAKDFYLYQMLKNKQISQEELSSLRGQIFRFAGAIAKEYNKQMPNYKEPSTKNLECYKFDANNILNASLECQKQRLSQINFAKRLSAASLLQIAKNFAKSDAEFSKTLRIYAAKNPMQAAIKQGDSKLVLKLFYKGYKLDDYHFGPIARKNFLQSPLAYKFLNSALVDDKFKLIKSSLLLAKDVPAKIDSKLAFAMGLNMLIHKHNKDALAYFKASVDNAKYQMAKDNALWFVYLISKDKKVLKQLAESDNLNIYSLYAKELLQTKPFMIVVPKPTKSLDDEQLFNALAQARWMIKLKTASKDELNEWLQKYYASDSMGQYIAVYKRLNGYKSNIYPMPFAQYLSDANNDEKALIYSIAMQESQFLPASVSTSYALGMMQFMPFVARYTAKHNFGIENFDVNEMFKPQTALKFALSHIRMLKAAVPNVLFIAYAYNGGLGFTKRMLAKPNMFVKSSHNTNQLSDYEPFLSMELVPYLESRLYGKKVLANYYIYKQLLGQEISMKELIASIYKAN